MTVLPNGQIIPDPPPLILPAGQKVIGSAIDTAANKTVNAIQQQAAASRSLGVGQKGSGRRKRGGATNMNARIPSIPEAGTIPGVSFAQNHLDGTDNLNQIRADKVGDALINSPPIQLGGRLVKRGDGFYVLTSDTKRKPRTKKHGRRSHRNHRRKHNRTSRNRRRSRRNIH